MKVKALITFLISFFIISNVCVLATSNVEEESGNLITEEKCKIELTDIPEQVNRSQIFNVSVEITDVAENFTGKARWIYNGETIDGFENEKFIVTNDKKSTLVYSISNLNKEKKNFNIGFELITDEDEVIKVEKEIAVSDNVLDLNVALNHADIQIFKGEIAKVAAIITNNSNNSYSIPVAWQINNATIDGCANNDFIILDTRKSTYEFYAAEEFVNSTVKVSFVINPENVAGIIQKSVNMNIHVIDHPPEYYAEQNKSRVLSVIQPVNVEAVVTRNTVLYSDLNLKNRIGQVDNGTSVIYDDYNAQYAAHIVLQDGRSGWVPYNNIWISDKDYTVYEDFCDEDKNTFINAMGYSSETSYLAWINLERQKVNVFMGNQGNWSLTKTMTCATGKNNTPTIAGVFKYSKRVPLWDFGDFYVRPVLIFNGGHAFHSRTYKKKDGNLLDATLGTPASHGCIRMLQEDVDWLEYYLPLNSTVVVY